MLAAVLALLASATIAFELAELDEQQARSVVSAYLVEQGLPEEKQAIELNDISPDPEFFMFDAMHRYDRPGSVVVGFFGVNKRTGDVWEMVLCKRVSSRRLSSLQRAIREKSALSPEEWKRFHALKPRRSAGCE